MTRESGISPTQPEAQVSAETSFTLAGMEVLNWGPFHGKHSCEIDPVGTAVIGPTGSGKTTLIDALMTLLAPQPKYNLASTGGHESDRDLISYIRGVSGAESASGENSHIARPGKTLTGLAATYTDGRDQVVLGAIFWVDGASNATDDLKRLWFFAKGVPKPLDELLKLHHEGGKRSITRHAAETVGLRTFASKKEYLAQVRSFFEVGENAFSLLNRAAGLKQLNSIDQIFRDLVLDDRSAFDRALQVAGEFDTLQGIYVELQTARCQRDSLLPVATQQEELEKVRTELARRQHLKTLLPIWFADRAAALWQTEIERLEVDFGQTGEQIKTKEAEAIRCQEKLNLLQEAYLKLGGSTVESLEKNLTTTERLAASIRRDAESYQRDARVLQWDDTLEERAFQRNLMLLPERKAALLNEHDRLHEASLNVASQLRDKKGETEDLARQIKAVQDRPLSNIPPLHQAFREALAGHLGLAVHRLPFVAELVEVKSQESLWRGAIERAIGSERLRILVPADRLSEALAWINRRDNRLHVRLQRADERPPPARFFEDGFTHKLNYRKHPLCENVKYLLGQRDRHCVASTEELKHTEHGMTAEGTMSGREGGFEKQDQRPLAEGWMTGFDNSDQLQSLSSRLRGALAAAGDAETEARKRREEESSSGLLLLSIERLEKLNFSLIDLPKVQVELADLQEQLAALIRPDSETSKAKASYDSGQIALEGLRRHINELNQILGGHERFLNSARAEQQRALFRRGGGLGEGDAALAAKAFPVPELEAVGQLNDIEREAMGRIDEKIEQSEGRQSSTIQKLIRAMEAAKREDTGALAETGTELNDVPDYLGRLRVLEDEALPEKLQRFLEYLNKSSGQGVAQLLSHIDGEVAIIEERISDLNATLSRVDFRAGQYLQLEPSPVVHESLRQLKTAHQKLRLVAMKGEDDEGAAHYRALGEVIRIVREAAENRRTLASQALLDPRHRLQFFVVEIDRASGHASGRRTGSQTGSGGEKEMMASYILTASLSYALCPVGSTRPRYATIVLDEAFSKSSPAAASRIIAALRAFGLHPLFVTPNKEIALLKVHTRSAILVHNKGKRATLASLTWQEIADHERNRS